MGYIPPMVPNLILAPTRYNLIYPGFPNAPIWGYRLNKRAQNELHWHTYTQIWYTLRGSYYHTVNGKRVLMKEGDAAIILPYSVHAVDSSESDMENSDILTVYISRKLWEEKLLPFFPITYKTSTYENTLLPTLLHFEGEEKEYADTLFRNMLQEFLRKRDIDCDVVLDNLDKFFRLSASKSEKQLKENEAQALCEQADRIYDAVRYITENFSKKLPLSALSKVSLMSERSFTNKFKATTGITYHSYLKSVRLSEAVTKLRYGKESIYTIARECGFSNSGHFINTCARMSGFSPVKLREHLLDWIGNNTNEKRIDS